MRCPQHPDRIAAVACTVCGLRSCPACAPDHPALAGPVCGSCAPSVRAPELAPPRAPRRWPLIVVGLVLGLGAGALLLRDRPDPPPPTMADAVEQLRVTGLALDAARTQTGAWPADLAGLGSPPDPFAPSRPLRFGPAPARSGALTLWSVGPDGIDHGGSPLDPVTGRGDVAVPLE